MKRRRKPDHAAGMTLAGIVAESVPRARARNAVLIILVDPRPEGGTGFGDVVLSREMFDVGNEEARDATLGRELGHVMDTIEGKRREVMGDGGRG